MNKEEVMNSVELKKRFAEDYGIPIAVFENPYFGQRMETLEILYKAAEKFDQFCDYLSKFKNEDDFFAEYDSIKRRMVEYIKEKKEYKDFCGERFNPVGDYDCEPNWLYSDDNDSGTFISINMNKADFASMARYSRHMFAGSKTWEEFVATFTDSEYMKGAKNIRRDVFSACNRKQQKKYEKYLTSILFSHMRNFLPDGTLLVLADNDEIIITVANPNMPCLHNLGISMNKLKEIVQSCTSGIGNMYRVNLFDLHKAGEGWIKSYNCGVTELIGYDKNTVNQVVKHYFNMPISEDDLVFEYNDKLAKFLKEIDNPWKE